ncbi:Protein GrpE [uncultured archaeon]|nr:Protein GrpE [uncultured archaeon]
MVDEEADLEIEAPDQEPDEIAGLKDSLARLQADFDNYRKRAFKDNALMKEQNFKEFFTNLLDILDDLEYGAKSDEQVKLFYEKLVGRLNKLGFTSFGVEGEKLDPQKHEVLGRLDGKDGIVVKIVQKGWSYKDNQVRPARVMVGEAKETENKKV